MWISATADSWATWTPLKLYTTWPSFPKVPSWSFPVGFWTHSHRGNHSSDVFSIPDRFGLLATSHQWKHTVWNPRVSFLNSAQCFCDLSMSLWASGFTPFYCWVVLHLWIYHSRFIHSFTDGFLCGSQCGVIMSEAAINIFVQVLLWTHTFISLGEYAEGNCR